MTVRLRTDYTAAELRRLATVAAEPEKGRRLLALALVLEGASRAAAARSTGMDRQTLRDWVHRFNEHGPDALADRQAPGRQRRLSPEQQQELAGWLETGPDREQDGVVRWRLADLCARVEQRFGLGYQERGMGKIVRALGFRRISARPVHPETKPEAQLEFKKNCPTGSLRPSATRGKANDSRSGFKTKAASAKRAT